MGLWSGARRCRFLLAETTLFDFSDDIVQQLRPCKALFRVRQANISKGIVTANGTCFVIHRDGSFFSRAINIQISMATTVYKIIASGARRPLAFSYGDEWHIL